LRFWHNGEDEDYNRELARVQRFGGMRPAPVSKRETAAVVLLLSAQALMLAALADWALAYGLPMLCAR
jgi:hypothetical protein